MGSKSIIPGVSKPFSEMTGIGKVTFVAATIGTIMTAVIGTHQVGSYSLDKLDERTSRVVVDSQYVNNHVLNLIDENAYSAVRVAFEQRNIVSDIHSMSLELRMIKSEIRDLNSISESRPLTPDEKADLEELKLDREHIKQEIKDLEYELRQFNG